MLALSALGVVFGDIGISPLYTLKTVLNATGAHPTRTAMLGSFALIFWTLIIITSIKYVAMAMRIATVLLFIAMREICRRNRSPKSAAKLRFH